MRCDFSGESVKNATVWHCPRSKDAALHPFGHDVCTSQTENYRTFQLNLRREDRMRKTLEEMADETLPALTLSEKHEALCREITTPVSLCYMNMKEDASRMSGHEGRPVAPELQARIERMKVILIVI